ncbi:putative membrane protein (Fun14 family) [Deinococcus sp. HSC-46F16]|uniref:FUN14 domain-containing protein n=1 Tax=Deinococcus sp. HSC-46F16 TaxID=2910968 RepID=UPI0020A1E181|nr:FUN14 domain-containing protein [Deinococcus sp. HSC-46F16]MCP2013807.1 putative membrane protein (Fun14 family) [Deinococcus sp. HSC-46F16]
MSSPPTFPSPDASITEALRSVLPDLSVGALLGFATGLALRKVGRLALIALGLLFVAVQLLASWDLLSVNWPRVQALAEPVLRQGGEAGAAWLGRVLTANLPFAGAYTAGLVLGLRARG